jgi:hypothetical protein
MLYFFTTLAIGRLPPFEMHCAFIGLGSQQSTPVNMPGG